MKFYFSNVFPKVSIQFRIAFMSISLLQSRQVINGDTLYVAEALAGSEAVSIK